MTVSVQPDVVPTGVENSLIGLNGKPIGNGGATAEITADEISSPSLPSSDDEEPWDPAMEATARRKVDRSVLLLLVLGFLVFQLDRMNLASALTGGFATDIGIDQATINMGNQLMFMSVVIFEIPCNMLLHRFGARKWMAGQVFMFGTVAMMQVFVHDRAGFIATRIMLGVAESGYTPGAMYILSTWYKRRELAKRMSVFFFGMFGGNAISPMLATGILKLDEKRGLEGWQWLFLLEGVLTVIVSVLLLLFLPESPEVPHSLMGPALVRLSNSEKEILRLRLDTAKNMTKRGKAIGWETVKKTVLYYRRWPHYVSVMVVFSTFSPLSTYSPSIIMSLGFDRIVANALAAVGASLALPVVFCFGYISDKTNRRGGTVILAQACYLIMLIVARGVHPHVGKWSRWGLWTSVNSFAVGYHPVHNSWVQLNCFEGGERSIALAMWVMCATTGMMIGAQYFQADDKPFYNIGLRTMILMVSVGILFAAIQMVVYFVHNRRVVRGKYEPGDKRLGIVYTL